MLNYAIIFDLENNEIMHELINQLTQCVRANFELRSIDHLDTNIKESSRTVS